MTQKAVGQMKTKVTPSFGLTRREISLRVFRENMTIKANLITNVLLIREGV